jgi:hypothetical protein
LFEDEFKQGFMFGGIDFSQAARKDRDCPGFDRCLMRLGVDPAREAGDDDMPYILLTNCFYLIIF